jgi:maleylpyruvate isomerase
MGDLAPEDVAAVVAGGSDAAARFAADVSRLDDRTVHEPSLLPGWTRAMVIAHVAYVAERMAAMTDDPQVAMYVGGADERQTSVDAGRACSAADLLGGLAIAQAVLDERWSALPASTWSVVRHDPELGEMLLTRLPLMRWKEAEVHRTDLGIAGADPDWSPDYAATELPLRLTWLESHQRPKAGPDAPDGTWSIVATDLGRAWEVDADGPTVRVAEVASSSAAVAVSGTATAVLRALLGRGDVDPTFRAAFPGP